MIGDLNSTSNNDFSNGNPIAVAAFEVELRTDGRDCNSWT